MAQAAIRTLFLQEFTRNLILNSTKEPRDLFSHHPIKPEFQQMQIQPSIEEKQIIPKSEIFEIMSEMKPRQFQLSKPIQGFKPSFSPQNPNQRFQDLSPQIQKNPAIASITPLPQPLPEGFSLDKIDSLIADKAITMIECPGPNKPVLVKDFMGRTSPTMITLSEQDARKVIEKFSEAAKIPLMEGLFKAAIGNLVITAVLSEFVGSRFIINKYTPYSIIER